MTKLLIGLLGAGVIATGGYAAASGVDTDPARTVSLPAATSTGATTTTDTVDDVSGPCDEAEHRNDPRCTGTSSPAPAPATTTDDTVEDDSGPCDEAEHANDARCTGGAAADDDRGDDDRGDDDRDGDDDGDDDSGHDGDGDDDRSGSNSGKG